MSKSPPNKPYFQNELPISVLTTNSYPNFSSSLYQIQENVSNPKFQSLIMDISVFSEPERLFLKSLAVNYKKDWKRISFHFNKKYSNFTTPMYLKAYFDKFLSPEEKGIKFTLEEDIRIVR